MGRKKKAWPPAPATDRGQERVWWHGRYHYLGSTGSDAAKAKYARLLALWAADPGAAARPAGEYLVPELWADYMVSPDCPAEARQRGRVRRAGELLAELHLATPTAAFTGTDLGAWQRWLNTLVHPPGTRRGRPAAAQPDRGPRPGGGGQAGVVLGGPPGAGAVGPLRGRPGRPRGRGSGRLPSRSRSGPPTRPPWPPPCPGCGRRSGPWSSSSG